MQTVWAGLQGGAHEMLVANCRVCPVRPSQRCDFGGAGRLTSRARLDGGIDVSATGGSKIFLVLSFPLRPKGPECKVDVLCSPADASVL